MKKKVEELLPLFMKELDQCKETAECCFHICGKYWKMIREELAGYQFPAETEEIDFFKNLKPIFSSRIEYYSLLYHSEIFRPDISDPAELERFWIRQARLLDKFIDNHSEFYQYFKSGKVSHDTEYFTRAGSLVNVLPGGVFTNPDVDTVTSHDPLVAELLALEAYKEYAEGELRKCKM